MAASLALHPERWRERVGHGLPRPALAFLPVLALPTGVLEGLKVNRADSIHLLPLARYVLVFSVGAGRRRAAVVLLLIPPLSLPAVPTDAVDPV